VIRGSVAGLDGHPVTGKKGHGPVPVDTTVGQVSADDFDALVIPGGYAPDKLRRSQAVLALVRAFDPSWATFRPRTPRQRVELRLCRSSCPNLCTNRRLAIGFCPRAEGR
jgi:DJ-1/PfpI family